VQRGMTEGVSGMECCRIIAIYQPKLLSNTITKEVRRTYMQMGRLISVRNLILGFSYMRAWAEVRISSGRAIDRSVGAESKSPFCFLFLVFLLFLLEGVWKRGKCLGRADR
jgi:hypothetical protein